MLSLGLEVSCSDGDFFSLEETFLSDVVEGEILIIKIIVFLEVVFFIESHLLYAFRPFFATF